jgi:hypothetical protein
MPRSGRRWANMNVLWIITDYGFPDSKFADALRVGGMGYGQALYVMKTEVYDMP